MILSLLLVVAMSLLFTVFKADPENATQPYAKNLSGLTSTLKKLDDNLIVPEMNQIDTALETYNKQVAGLTQYCHQLIKQKKPDNTNKGKVIGERVTGICQDLLPVLFYTGDLYKKLSDYLLISDSEWPPAESIDFARRLDDTTEIIIATRSDLEQLNNKDVQDPALEELIYQVKLAQDLAAKIKSANGNNDKISKQAEELQAVLSRDRSDFLAARTYFWKNTIGIAQLHKALADAQSTLPQQ